MMSSTIIKVRLSLSQLLLVVLSISIIQVVNGSFITTINTDALRSVVQDVRDTLIPNLISIVNNNIITNDILSISTQVGTCCNRGDTGVKLSINLSDIRINQNTYNTPLMTTIPSSSAVVSTSTDVTENEIGQILFETRNIDLNTKVVSQIAISFGLLNSNNRDNCNPAIRVFMKMPQLSFRMNLQKDSNTGNLFNTDASNNNLGVSSYKVSMSNVNIDPIGIYLSVVDDTSGICDNILNPITIVLNKAASLLSERATNTFRNEITNYITNNLFDTIPIALNVPIPLDSGKLNINLGLQSLQTTNNGILSIIGSSFTSTITQIDWRNMYSYNRIMDSTDTDNSNDINTAQSLLNNNNNNHLIQMRVSFPPINNMLAAIWHQVWAGLATDRTIINNSEDFDLCTFPNTTTDSTDTVPINDPCPFPPIRNEPFSILDKLLLRVLFIGHNDFKYQTVIEPPIMSLLQNTNTNNETDKNVIVQGRVPTKLVLRGTRTRTSTLLRTVTGRQGTSSNNIERTIALLDLDIVMNFDIPGYDINTGIIQWNDGLSIRIENAVSDTRFQLVGTTFTNIATRFMNQFIDRRLIGPMNRAIQLGLNEIPIRIPNLQNFPIQNSNIQFTLPNFNLNYIENGINIVSDLNIDINNPTASVVSNEDDEEALIISKPLIETFAYEVINSTTTTTTNNSTNILLYTTVFDTEKHNDTIQTQTTRVVDSTTNKNDNSIVLQEYVNGKWVPLVV